MLTGSYFYPFTQDCPVLRKRALSLDVSLPDEFDLTYSAKKYFEHHDQPKIYCLGDIDKIRWNNSDPKDMFSQVELANKYGIDFFIFDTYIGVKNNKIVHELINPLNKAFLGNPAIKDKMKFALSLILQSPRIILPSPPQKAYKEPGRAYSLTKQLVHEIVKQCAETYWQKSNYLYIKNRPYISLIIPSYGGKKDVYDFFSLIKDYAWKRYKIDPYLVGTFYATKDIQAMISHGADALTNYAFLPNYESENQPIQKYRDLIAQRIKDWKNVAETVYPAPFIPPVVVGWDGSPRGRKVKSLSLVKGFYPFTPIVIDSNSKNFEYFLTEAHLFIDRHVPKAEQYVILTAWNEISEGCSLLPRVRKSSVDFSILKVVRKIKNKFAKLSS